MVASEQTRRASDYVRSAESVFRAAQRLQQNRARGGAALLDAVTGLQQAANSLRDGGATYRALMFQDALDRPSADQATRQDAQDALATVLVDLHVANVLMTAGQTLGETDERVDTHLFDEAVLRLHTVLPDIARPEQDPTRHFRFSESVEPPILLRSADLPASIETFRQRADETLSALVSESQNLVTGIFEAFAKLDAEKVQAAIEKLGQGVELVPALGPVFRQGAQIAVDALDSLSQLAGAAALAQVRETISQLWDELRSGSAVRHLLEWSFDVKTTQARIGEILGAPGLEQQVLDDASGALVRLDTEFRATFGLMRGILRVLRLVIPLLSVGPFVPQAGLFTAGAYVLLLGVTVLIGMDYADSGRILRRVRGVGQIVAAIAPAQRGGATTA